MWRCHKKKKNEPCLKWRLSRLFLTRKFLLSVPESFPIVSIFPWSTGSKLMEGSTQGGLLVIAERHLGVRRRYRPSEDGENKTPFNTAEKHSFRVNEAQNTRMLSLQTRLQPSEHGTSIKFVLYNNQLHIHSSTATQTVTPSQTPTEACSGFKTTCRCERPIRPFSSYNSPTGR